MIFWNALQRKSYAKWHFFRNFWFFAIFLNFSDFWNSAGPFARILIADEISKFSIFGSDGIFKIFQKSIFGSRRARKNFFIRRKFFFIDDRLASMWKIFFVRKFFFQPVALPWKNFFWVFKNFQNRVFLKKFFLLSTNFFSPHRARKNFFDRSRGVENRSEGVENRRLGGSRRGSKRVLKKIEKNPPLGFFWPLFWKNANAIC